jgi:hypothetical protein
MEPRFPCSKTEILALREGVQWFPQPLARETNIWKVKKAHFTLLIVADYCKVWEMVDSIYSILTFRLPSMSVEARLRVGGE